MSRGLAVMSGGELLISGPEYVDAIARAVTGMARLGRKDGISPSPVLRDLLDASDLALRRQDGRAEYRELPSQADFRGMEDLMGTTAAAEKLGVSPRAVRALCERGALDGAVLRKRAWLIPREVVLARANDKEEN